MRNILIILLLNIAATGFLKAQQPDTTVILTDTIVSEAPVVKEGFFKKGYPDPKKAGLMSLVVPGSGQIYNKDWWKVPFVYAAIGGLVYAINYNNEQYDRFQTAYQLTLDGKENEFTGTPLGQNTRALRSIRDGFDKNRQLSYIGLVAVYLLNGVEAFVAAHLNNFDISDDLSMQLRPELGIDPLSQHPTFGFGVRIPLSQTR